MTEPMVSPELQKTEVIQLGVTTGDIKALIAEKANKKLIQGDKKSYLEVKSALMDFVHVRNKIDDRRKEINRETNDKAKALLALLDPHEKALRVQVEKEEARLAAIKAEEERKEKERKDTIKMQLDKIRAMGLITALTPSTDIKARIDRVFELKNFSFQEFADEMETLTDDVMGTLAVALENRKEFERREAAQKEEAERLAKEKAELAKQKAELEPKKDPIEPFTIFNQPQPLADAIEHFESKPFDQPQEKATPVNLPKEIKIEPAMISDKDMLIQWANEIIKSSAPPVRSDKAAAIVWHVEGELLKVGNELLKAAEAL